MYKRFIKYWLKLLRSPQGSLLQTCYKMQTDFDAIYKRGWATNFKKLLFSNGFGLAQETQGVGKKTSNNEIVVHNSQRKENLVSFKSRQILIYPDKYSYSLNV